MTDVKQELEKTAAGTGADMVKALEPEIKRAVRKIARMLRCPYLYLSLL